MRLAIVGTRQLGGCTKVIFDLCREAITRYRPREVVSGGAPGVDSIAAASARIAGYHADCIKQFTPTQRRWWGAGGFEERNRRIVGYCTHLLAIRWAGSTTWGSGWTYEHAVEGGVPALLVTVPLQAPVQWPDWGPELTPAA